MEEIDPLVLAIRTVSPEAVAHVVYSDARRRLFSWRHDETGRGLHVRVSPQFRDAPPAVAHALARVVTARRLPHATRRGLMFTIRSWLVDTQSTGTQPGRALAPKGRHVDLDAVLARVLERHFPDPPRVRIGWTPRARRYLMGRYDHGTPEGVVFINLLLDSLLVPVWYLDFLVFHEVLHAVIRPRPGRSRLLIHPPEFRQIERRHADFQRAREFERWVTGPGFRTLSNSERTARAPC